MCRNKYTRGSRAETSRRLGSLWLTVIIFATALFSAGCGTQATDAEKGAQVEEVRSGSFPRWCAANDLITFTDQLNGQFEVFTMKPDGSEVRCLTAGKEALADCGNRGQSAWHPSGKYIVFEAENANLPRAGLGASARPGWGRNFNVWIMSSDGQSFWKLTDYPENWAIFETDFSRDGTKVCWGEEYSMEKYPNGKPGDKLLPGDNPTGPPWGHPGAYHGQDQIDYRRGEEMLAWRIVFADIKFGPEGPALSNLKKLDPPEGITNNEVNGFTPDDSGFICCFSVLSETSGIAYAGELFTVGLDGTIQKRLTATPQRHDEDPCYSPDGMLIAYKETTGRVGLEPDLYLMNSDGTGVRRLTHFAEPGYAEYDPAFVDPHPEKKRYVASGTQITEICFSPDGKRLVFGHCKSEQGSMEAIVDIPSSIYILTI